MSIDRVPGAPASNVALTQSLARPTPTPVRPSFSFGAVLAATAKPLSSAVSALPGSSVMAAALRNGPAITLSGGASAGTLGGVSGGSGVNVSAAGPGGGAAGGVGLGAGGTSTGNIAGDMMAMQEQLLQEQVAVQSASEQFTSQSNILNAEHSARMSAIQNLRA